MHERGAYNRNNLLLANRGPINQGGYKQHFMVLLVIIYILLFNICIEDVHGCGGFMVNAQDLDLLALMLVGLNYIKLN